MPFLIPFAMIGISLYAIVATSRARARSLRTVNWYARPSEEMWSTVVAGLGDGTFAPALNALAEQCLSGTWVGYTPREDGVIVFTFQYTGYMGNPTQCFDSSDFAHYMVQGVG